jgi:hypothetical protein
VNSLLRHLRKETAQHRLWIDAICLNQADNEEKSVQVQLMGEIYSQARKLRIWLGETDSDTPKIFAFLKTIAGMSRWSKISPQEIAEKVLL